MSQCSTIEAATVSMRRLGIFILAVVVVPPLLTSAGARSRYSGNWDYYNQLAERQATIQAALAGQYWMAGDDSRRRIYLGIVKVHTGIDRQTGLRYLRDAVAEPGTWFCFDLFSFMDAVLRLGDRLPPDLIAAGKDKLAAGFGADKGFTDNHKLQYRTARYLFGQTWPDGPSLADGGTAREAMAEAEAWIFDWADRMLDEGMYEYDSVNYHQLYLLCLTSLYDFAQDPRMKRLSWMMMQLLLADWAPEYLVGNWIGAHSREKYNQVTHTILNCGTSIPFGYLFFGNSQFHPELAESYFVALGAVQGFRPLSILGDMATDRSVSYVHRERKAPRRGLGICSGDIPVWKYSYVTKDYGLGSSYGDISAVENHRWDLTWVSEHDGSTCFFINPCCDRDRLRYYFGDPPEEILENILKQRPYYSDPNKWIEGSIYERLLQQENCLIALYDIPERFQHDHVNGFFPTFLERRFDEASGWIFCAADSVYFAVRPLTKGTWSAVDDHFRLCLNDRRTGVVMEVAQVSEFEDFKAFQRQIRSNPLQVDMDALRVRYRDSRGDELDFTWGGKRLINGQELDLATWDLFDGPFVYSKLGSKVVELRVGREQVVLDFNDLTVSYAEIPASGMKDYLRGR